MTYSCQVISAMLHVTADRITGLREAVQDNSINQERMKKP
jgi:hypothetical protein